MISVILLMAGTGSRMNMDKNKVLLQLDGKEIFMHSYDKFKSKGLEVVCVINPIDEELIRKSFKDDVIITYGGPNRQESVYNGLKVARGDYILIHDAARPLISQNLIDTLIDKAQSGKPILTYFKCKNTVKSIELRIETLNRDNIIFATTPQCGKKEDFIYCHKKAKEENFIATDDISLFEKYLDKEIELVEANEENFKITTKIDYELAKLLVKGEEND